MQFADNTTIFLENSTENIVNFKKILQLFLIMYRLKVNYTKSLYAWHDDEERVNLWPKNLCCKKSKMPIKYSKILGVPIRANIRKRSSGSYCYEIGQKASEMKHD